MQNQNTTNFEHNSEQRADVKSKRPRRRAAHIIEQETKEGVRTKCGHFIKNRDTKHVHDPANHPDYFPCEPCGVLYAAEKELEQDRALLLLANIHKLASKEL